MAIAKKKTPIREHRMGLRIKNEMYDRLVKQAELIGLPPATFVVVAIGQHVANLEEEQKIARMKGLQKQREH